jgi:hypothetical protein
VVLDLLRRLFGNSTAPRARVVCHLRENGPIAYELDFFTPASREGADVMLASSLTWGWKSPGRDWTELTAVSLSALLADRGSGEILMVGIAGELSDELTDATVRGWIRRFCRTDPSPLAAVVSVAGGRQLLFVEQQAPGEVNDLLERWRIDKGDADLKPYARLGPASLEAIGDRLAAT